jgi:hypothetical protein
MQESIDVNIRERQEDRQQKGAEEIGRSITGGNEFYANKSYQILSSSFA